MNKLGLTFGLVCLEILVSTVSVRADSVSQAVQSEVTVPISPPVTGSQADFTSQGHDRTEAPNESSSDPTSVNAPPADDSQDVDADDPLAQVTSVSQLSDVQPTDWAFQALQSLVERYGVIQGYPDGLFRGNRALSRYEFAAAVDAALAQVQQLVEAGDRRQSLQEDLLTLQRLQAFYRTALGSLRDRMDGIEDRVTRLEEQNFSATTKLQGQTVLAITDGTDAKTTLVSRTRLTLASSFTPGDQLITQLELGNDGLDAINLAQSKTGNLLSTNGVLVDGGGLEYTGYSGDVRLYRLYYTFNLLPDLTVAVGPKLVPSDFVDRNSYANDSTQDFSSSFFVNNPLIVQNQIDRVGGAGLALTWQVRGLPLTLRALYVAADAAIPGGINTGGGLFGDRQQGTLEAEYAFTKYLTARLQYTVAGINLTDIQAGGLNVEWAMSRGFGVFARFGIADYSEFNFLLKRELDLHPKTWAIGAVVRDFLIPGTLAGLAVGQPFVDSDLGDATQTNFEAFLKLSISDNLSITPSLMLVTNPNNDDSGADIWQWALRTVFSF